jgi:lipoprotein-anchoring transpeptidase ErfK/SrfK
MIFMILMTSSTLFAYKEVVVDLSEQRAYAIEDGYIVFEGRISSGKFGRETPNGEFSIIQKKRYHKSNLWPKPNGGAKMNYMMRLTNSGIAMHLGYVPDRPASHGCIRLKNGFAQKMYRWASVGTPVYVEGDIRDYVRERDRYRDRYDTDDYGMIDYHD